MLFFTNLKFTGKQLNNFSKLFQIGKLLKIKKKNSNFIFFLKLKSKNEFKDNAHSRLLKARWSKCIAQS